MVIVLKPHATEVEIAMIKRRSHLPMIVDPSHGTGKWRLASPMALAEVTSGATVSWSQCIPTRRKPCLKNRKPLLPTHSRY